MMRFFVWLATCLAGLALPIATTCVHAHPISLSAAIVDVQGTQIQVDLEIMLEDLVLYHGLSADGNSNYSAADLKEAANKHREFLLKYFSILDSNGDRLPGKIVSEDVDQIEASGVAQSEMMRRSVLFRIQYPLAQAQPRFLTFLQNFGGPQAALPAVMDVHVLQDGKFFNLSEQIAHGRPHTVQLDWNQKESDAPVTFAEVRKKRAAQRKERLGISSYTGIFSFLYITPFEVRHEILIPLLTLEQWIPIARKNPDFLEVEEQQAARESIERFFQKKNPVTINGTVVEGSLTRLNFFGLDINDFALNAEPRRVSIHQARIGVILSFPSPTVPKTVRMNWETFSEYAPYLQSVILIGKESPQKFTFQPQTTQFDWQGSLVPPSIEAVRANESSLPPVKRVSVVGSLLKNVYSAFEYRDDESIYNALNSAIAGNLLREMYLRIKRTLLVAEQGGAMSYVTAVDVQSVEPSPSTAGSLDAKWRVTSVTEHWGHVHTRVSEYRARLTVQNKDDFWKLERFQLLEEKRIQFETSLRGND